MTGLMVLFLWLPLRYLTTANLCTQDDGHFWERHQVIETLSRTTTPLFDAWVSHVWYIFRHPRSGFMCFLLSGVALRNTWSRVYVWRILLSVRCRLPWAFVGFAFVDKAIGRCRSSLLREQKVFHFCCNRRFMETGALTILRNIADPTHLSFAFSQQLCIFQLSLDVDQCQQNAKFAELEPGKWRSLFREVHRRCVFVSTLVRVVQSCTCKQWFFVFSRSGWKIWRFPQCACQWHGEPW